jgi:hypothetical protein
MQPQIFCQRWRARRDSYRPAGETINTTCYEVAPIDMRTAKTFVITHHYSQSYPACRFRFGLFTRGELVGVAVFSMPMARQVLTNVFPGDPLDSVELGRFVLLDNVPANGETWFKARCRTLLKNEGIRGIIAFSDDIPRTRFDGSLLFRGHVGTIYQASNAVYLGRGSRGTLRLFDDGTVFSARTISKIRNQERGWEYSCRQLIERGADQPRGDLRVWLAEWLPRLTRPLRHPGNLKYAWALDRSTRLPVSRPYPKRPNA